MTRKAMFPPILILLLLLVSPTYAQQSTPGEALRQCAGSPVHANYDNAIGDMKQKSSLGQQWSPVYYPETCDCIARNAGWHLIGGAGKDACAFLNPPLSFDPSHASSSKLSSWGIPIADAKFLGDTMVRESYFAHVKRSVDGETCDRFSCYPGLTTRLESAADLVFCELPNNMLNGRYCGPHSHTSSAQ
jgi:hypothetical protein